MVQLRLEAPPAPSPLACSAQNSGAGKPLTVTCQVDVAFNDLPVEFTAQAFKGAPGDQFKDLTLRSFESDPYR